MKNFIKSIFLILAACLPQVSHAMLQNQPYAESCLVPKNSVEFNAHNKHTRNNNAQSISQQIQVITPQNTRVTQASLGDRLFDRYVGEPTISNAAKFTFGYMLPTINMAGDILSHTKALNSKPYSYNHLPDAPQQIIKMAQELCPTMGIEPTSLSVKFDKTNDNASAHSLAKTLCIGENFTNLPSYQQRAIIKHELVHIKYNDTRSYHVAAIVTPVATTAISLGSAFAVLKFSQWAQQKARKNGWNNSAHYIHTTSKWISSGLQLPYFHHIMSQLIQLKYSRFQEKRADLQMTREAKTATGFSDWLKEDLQKYPQLALGQRLISWTSKHPTHEERIKYLEPYVQQEK